MRSRRVGLVWICTSSASTGPCAGEARGAMVGAGQRPRKRSQ